MSFGITPAQSAIVDAIGRICAKYDDAFWLGCDNDHRFPEEFVRDIAAGGYLGIAMPEAHGGAGLGVTEAALMMHRIASSGAGMAGVSAVHINIFGPHPIAVFGSEAQKARILPPLIRGETRCCFGVTEPDAGLDTASLKTRAERSGNQWLVNGRKMWTTTAQSATHILLLARTSPKGKKPTDGLSLFYTTLDRAHVEVREIAKMGRHAIDTNMLFIDNLPVPADDLVGEEGKGFDYLLHAFNPERILIAAEAIGIGQDALQVRGGGEHLLPFRDLGMRCGRRNHSNHHRGSHKKSALKRNALLAMLRMQHFPPLGKGVANIRPGLPFKKHKAPGIELAVIGHPHGDVQNFGNLRWIRPGQP